MPLRALSETDVPPTATDAAFANVPYLFSSRVKVTPLPYGATNAAWSSVHRSSRCRRSAPSRELPTHSVARTSYPCETLTAAGDAHQSSTRYFV